MRSSQVLGPEGVLAEQMPGYEHREPQLRMAHMVETCLEHEGVALIEAGTGTGKTLAYLVPALNSGRRVIISTATRTLQDQIMERDLPALRRYLDGVVDAACMKGLGNYLCRRRYGELLASPEVFDPSYEADVETVRDWVRSTEKGDRSELRSLPEAAPIWSAIQSGSDTRIGARCSYFEECFVTAMRRRAEQAQLIVVNHHLYFADLALRGGGGGGVLPDHSAVVFDEAHQLEDIATLFFGVQLSEGRIVRLVRDADRALRSFLRLDGPAQGVLRSVTGASEDLFAQLFERATAGEGRAEVQGSTLTHPLVQSDYLRLDTALEALELRCVRESELSEGIAQLARRTASMRQDLSAILEPKRQSIVWLDRAGSYRKVVSSPVDVSGLFREQVIYRVPSVILTSATLTTGGHFRFVRERLGLDEMELDEEVLPSTFDFPRQAALYLPEVPDPRADAFVERAAEEIDRLCSLTEGGTFVLCTSNQRMRQFAARSSVRDPLVQGQAPKAELLERFRASGRAVLYATMSFWEGVDVPGFALRSVIVDRLPFEVPTDPLVAARCRQIDAAGVSSFGNYLLPAAALTLKQGFGRLIRSRSDFGIVTILDSRIRTKGYGRVFLDSLPPARRCDRFEEVMHFWAEGRNGACTPDGLD